MFTIHRSTIEETKRCRLTCEPFSFETIVRSLVALLPKGDDRKLRERRFLVRPPLGYCNQRMGRAACSSIPIPPNSVLI